MNSPFQKSNRVSSGFTIVETLVAIAILMIAVAGPLVAASRSLNAALYSRDQMIGSFLAQETMEVIKSRRSNVVNVDPANWPGGYASCTAVSPCEVSATDPSLSLQTCPVTGCVLRLGTDGFSTSGTEPGLIFYRRFYLVSRSVSPIPEYRVHVIVGWNQGKIPYELEVVSELLSANK
ncbi:MAG: putative Type IV pilus pilin [Parcubacteria bacterium C7867-002]|nr:MAG: putative Type IV pilus pilin [Parcubacteria bacterium C7867-002]